MGPIDSPLPVAQNSVSHFLPAGGGQVGQRFRLRGWRSRMPKSEARSRCSQVLLASANQHAEPARLTVRSGLNVRWYVEAGLACALFSAGLDDFQILADLRSRCNN